MKKVLFSSIIISGVLLTGLVACTSSTAESVPEPTPTQTATPAPTPEQEKSTASPEADTVLLDAAQGPSDLTSNFSESYLLETFELVYNNNQSDPNMQDIERFENECQDIQLLIDSESLPADGVTLYSDWRLANHPVETPAPEETTPAPADTTPAPVATPAPSTKPAPAPTPTPTPAPVQANQSLPKTTEEKDTKAQQSQQQQQSQQATASSNFSYPAGASTSGMTADEISRGLYYRTDKGNKVYNQEGKYQGYCVGRPEEQKVATGDDLQNAMETIYGDGDGSGADTSNFS